MSQKQKKQTEKTNRLIAEARKEMEQRQKGYRERALKMFPWVCGKCGREFSGKRVKELTVHHRDHNHDNNPPDGSNWELLCIYCHDNEHSRYQDAQWSDTAAQEEEKDSSFSHNPFAGLDALLKAKNK